MLVAVAIVINYFRIAVPIGGAPVLNIAFGGPFIKFAGLLFGPIYGGAAGAAVDLAVHFSNPQGAYIWELTLVEFIKGATIAFLFYTGKRIRFSIFNGIYIAVCAIALVWGAANFAALAAFPESGYALLLGSIGRRSDYISIGLIAAGLVGLVPYIILRLATARRSPDFFEQFCRLLPAVGLPCLVLTVVNTFVLRRYGIFTSVPFMAICIPRVIEEFIMVLFNVYLLSILIKVYGYAFKRNVG